MSHGAWPRRAVRWKGGIPGKRSCIPSWCSSERSPQVRLCSCFGEGTIPISLMASITSHSCCFSRLGTRNLQASVVKNEVKAANSRGIPVASEELHSLSVASLSPFGVLALV